MAQPPTPDPPPRRAALCRRWQRTGQCRYGEACRFVHAGWVPSDGEGPPPRARWGERVRDAPALELSRASTAPLPGGVRGGGGEGGWAAYGTPIADHAQRPSGVVPVREAWGRSGAQGEALPLQRSNTAPQGWPAPHHGWAYGRPLRTLPSRDAWGTSMRRQQHGEAAPHRARRVPPWRRRPPASDVVFEVGPHGRPMEAIFAALLERHVLPGGHAPRRVFEFYELLLFLDEGKVEVGISDSQFDAEVCIVPYQAATHEEEMCTVCLECFGEDTTEPIAQLPCKHLFHAGCVKKWLKSHTRCPVCNWEGWKETTVVRDDRPPRHHHAAPSARVALSPADGTASYRYNPYADYDEL